LVTLSLLTEGFASACGLLMPIAAVKKTLATANARTHTATFISVSSVMIFYATQRGKASCHLLPMI
jgi:hypothetical protein